MWDGKFLPVVRKHRLYTGDIENHIEVKSVEEIDVEDIPAKLKRLGKGETAYLVTVGFTDGEDLYEYVIYSDEEPSTGKIKHEVGHDLTE